jgi:hypothetical protein
MKRTWWVLLVLAEIMLATVTLVLARPVLSVPLKIAFTALRRWSDVFEPNAFYFLGMLSGSVVRIAPGPILVWHAIWIARKRILQTNSKGSVSSE